MTISSEQYLLGKYGRMRITMRELASELGISYKSLLNAISAEAFEIPTYKEMRNRYADIRDVAGYLDRQREKSRNP